MNRQRFCWYEYLFSLAAVGVVMALCVCAGSVNVPLKDTLTAIHCAIWGLPVPEGISKSIILTVRLPRVICVALSGAALALCGAAMQGLLRNPLADGSTLGVSSGAALGAALSIVLGVAFPALPYAGSVIMAMAFAFGSLMLILALAYSLDAALSTNTIILVGVIYSMFVSSLMTLLITFAGEKMKTITFWTMGSLASSNMRQALLLLGSLVVFGGYILLRSRELNAFALSEDTARHLGVDVKKVKLGLMIASSALIGVCVSVGGTIAFAGLVVPHMTRLVVGPNHRRLLPASIFSGGIFLMLCDLAARMLLRPRELPIGVVTSLIGAVVFVAIFYRSRRGGAGHDA